MFARPTSAICWPATIWRLSTCPILRRRSEIVESRPVDGIVLDWVLPDAAGIEFIESVQSRSTLQVPPIVVSGSQPLSEQQVAEIHRCARMGPVRYAPTIERLLEETVLLLHRREKTLVRRNRNACWRSPAEPIRCWPAARCWWSTTMCATSSR